MKFETVTATSSDGVALSHGSHDSLPYQYNRTTEIRTLRDAGANHGLDVVNLSQPTDLRCDRHHKRMYLLSI